MKKSLLTKLLCFALSVILTASLAACGGGSAANTAQSSSGTQSTQPAVGAGDNTAAAADTTAASDGPLALKMTVRLFDNVPDMSNTYWQEYQKRANVALNVEFIPDGDYSTKLNLILASNDLPEVLVANNSNNLNNPAFISAVAGGAFWDLTDYLGDFSKYPNLKNNVAPDAWVTSRVLGRIYGVPQSVPQVQGAPIIREDLLKDAGVEMPTTMNELLDALEAIVKKDPSIIGLVSKQDMFNNANGGLASAFGYDIPVYDADGGLIYSKLTPAFTEFILWLKDAYSRGILSQEFSAMKPTQATELYQAGKAAVMINESTRWCFPFTNDLQKVKEGASATVTPPLEGHPGVYAIARGTGVVDTMFISKKVPEEKMLQILDYFERTTTQEFYDLTTYGIEGVHYTVDANGYKTKTEARDAEMGSSAPWQVLPLAFYPYMKLDSTAAPEQYNIDLRKKFSDYGYETKGLVDPFGVATSQTWISVWPKYQQDWAAKATQVVTGALSVDEYQKYVDQILADQDVKKAFQEFKESYDAVYGN